LATAIGTSRPRAAARQRPVHAAEHGSRERHDVVDHPLDRQVTPGTVHPADLDGGAAEAHDRGRHGINQQLDGEHNRGRRLHPHDGGRSTGRAEPRSRPLDHEARGGQLADEAADRAAGQARGRHQLGARQWSAFVEPAHDGAQVRTPDGLAPLAQVDATVLQGL